MADLRQLATSQAFGFIAVPCSFRMASRKPCLFGRLPSRNGYEENNNT
jgi:hypothetical protein